MAELTMVEAINRALGEAMEADERVLVLGQDVGVDGGVFRVTDGLLDRFGESRSVDTPLAESAIVGASIGMAVAGLRPVCEMQFSGFSYFGFHQLESHAARLRWRTRGGLQVPLVVRMPYGAGVRALEHHSESREIYYAHTPGLRVVVPSGPRQARALLRSAIDDPDPVVFFEPKLLYRSLREEVPDEPERQPLDRARIPRRGDDLTLVAYGAMLPRTLDAAAELAEDGVECEVVDLVTLAPLDGDAVITSVRKTGRAVVVHEAHRSYGPAAEIVARLNEQAFYALRAPVQRVTGHDVPVPYFAREHDYLPDVPRIVEAARRSLEAEA